MVCSTPNGEIMLEGETSKLDDCTTCICHEGLALCRGEECPPTLCSNPKPPGPKECCPTCPSVEDDEDTLKYVSRHFIKNVFRKAFLTSGLL